MQTAQEATMLPKRKNNRLAEYDYSSAGAYFVTICTQDKRRILSDIAVGEGLAPPVVRLTALGKIVDEQILAVPDRYPTIEVDKYVIMPNHVHLILSLREKAGGASPSPTVFDAVRAIKSLSTRLSRPHLGDAQLWQRSFHDHVIRGEKDYREIWRYIDENPQKWEQDELYFK